MPVYVDIFNRSEDPTCFRATARELYELPYGAWTFWEEEKFLPGMIRARGITCIRRKSAGSSRSYAGFPRKYMTTMG